MKRKEGVREGITKAGRGMGGREGGKEGEWKGGSEGRYYKLRGEWAEGGRQGGRVFQREVGRVDGRK